MIKLFLLLALLTLSACEAFFPKPGGGPQRSSLSLLFDWTDGEYVRLPQNSSLLSSKRSICISFWSYSLGSTGGNKNPINFSNGLSSGSRRFRINITNANLFQLLLRSCDSDAGSAATASGHASGAWEHWVACIDNTTKNSKIWRNNSLITNTTVSGLSCSTTDSTPSLESDLGATFSASAPTGFWNGYLDEMILFASSGGILTNSDVDILYRNSRQAGTITTMPLVAYWYMGESPDTILQVNDRIGILHGTPQNMEAADITAFVAP